MKLNLPITSDITSRSEYYSSPAGFFANFAGAWDGVKCQVLKLETRQVYQEPENPSFKAFLEGDLDGANRLMAEAIKADQAIYEFVRKNNIDFIRCRPIAFPASPYLQWELETYKHSSSAGERIFWCNIIQLEEIFSGHALHDFMVFDTRIAFIHDYDDEGLIRGGWKVENYDDIIALISLYGMIKAECLPLSQLK